MASGGVIVKIEANASGTLGSVHRQKHNATFLISENITNDAVVDICCR